MPYGDPRLRRARPPHRRGFVSPGYVESLQKRKLPPTDYRKLMGSMLPRGIMTFLGGSLWGPKGAWTAYSAYPSIAGLLNQYR